MNESQTSVQSWLTHYEVPEWLEECEGPSWVEGGDRRPLWLALPAPELFQEEAVEAQSVAA